MQEQGLPSGDVQQELDMTKRMLASKEQRCALLMSTNMDLTSEVTAANQQLEQLRAAATSAPQPMSEHQTAASLSGPSDSALSPELSGTLCCE